MPTFQVVAYPSPVHNGVPDAVTFHIIDPSTDAEIVSDFEALDHPEVPLTETQLDAVVARLSYVRVGPWRRNDADQLIADVAELESETR